MANAHIPKHSFNSPSALDVNYPHTILRHLRVVSVLVCFTWFLLLHPEKSESAPAPLIVYEGKISKSVIGPDGNPVSATESTYSFRAEIAQQLYRISIAAIKDLSCFEQVVGTDGVDSYFLHKSWPSWEDKATNAGYQEVAQVTPGLFPILAGPETQLVWIMCFACQGCLTNEPIILSHIAYAPYDELKMSVKYAENGSWPALVEVFSSGFEVMEGKKYPLPHPFEKGYKLWDFTAREGKNEDGFSYPKAADFFQYSVFADEKSAELRRIRRIQIIATNATEVPYSKQEFLPILSQVNLMATDYRYSPNIPRANMEAVGAIQYRLLEKQWLSRSNRVVNSSGVSLKVQTETVAHAAKTSGRRYVILVVFMILSSGFVFFWCRNVGEI